MGYGHNEPLRAEKLWWALCHFTIDWSRWDFLFESSRCMKLSSHLLLVLRMLMCGRFPPLPLTSSQFVSQLSKEILLRFSNENFLLRRFMWSWQNPESRVVITTSTHEVKDTKLLFVDNSKPVLRLSLECCCLDSATAWLSRDRNTDKASCNFCAYLWRPKETCLSLLQKMKPFRDTENLQLT